MRCACIDIGSNTTRLLVADHAGGALSPVVQVRTFTQLGRASRPREPLAEDVLTALAAVVAEQAAAARDAGATAVRVVATAALRRVSNGAEACAALSAAAGHPVELLSAEEEARLAFAGATASLAGGPAEPVGVADVGGGSSELIVGTRSDGVTWSRSLQLGSGDLAHAHLRADPPGAAELQAVRDAVAAALAGVTPPPVARAVAVGGSATSLARLVGPRLDADALACAVEKLVAAPAEVVAVDHDLDPARVRLLPAGLLVLAGVVALLGPLTVADGGLREGVVLGLAGA